MTVNLHFVDVNVDLIELWEKNARIGTNTVKRSSSYS